MIYAAVGLVVVGLLFIAVAGYDLWVSRGDKKNLASVKATFSKALLMGGVFIAGGALLAWEVHLDQPLSDSEVKESLNSTPCVATSLRRHLSQAERPVTGNELADIRDDCESKRSEELIQKKLQQQRKAADESN